MEPKVTVTIPNYNHAKYLPECIESILSQTFSDFELLIIDDASTDESADVLNQYLRLDKRVRVIWRKENRGVVQAMNQGIQEAKAPYYHALGADDTRYPDYIKCCMDVLLSRPDLGMCFTQFDWGSPENNQLESCGFEAGEEPIYIEPAEAIGRLLNHNLKVFGVSTILRTDLAKKHLFDEKLTYYSDWFLLNVILLNHPTAVIPKPLCFFRVHENNYSNVARHDKKRKLAAYNRMLEKLSLDKALREKFRKSALLTPIFQDLFWKMLFNPKYLTYWPYINKRYPIKNRIKKSFSKKLKKLGFIKP